MSGDINWRAEAFAEYDPNLNEIKKLDTLMHAFWILLQKTNGFTNEMLDEALAEAIEIESTGPAYLKGMVCPSCETHVERLSARHGSKADSDSRAACQQ